MKTTSIISQTAAAASSASFFPSRKISVFSRTNLLPVQAAVHALCKNDGMNHAKQTNADRKEAEQTAPSGCAYSFRGCGLDFSLQPLSL